MIQMMLPSGKGLLHRHAGNRDDGADAGVDIHPPSADTGVDVGVDEPEGFPGGPRDPLVLTEYAVHVAISVWNREERPELKLFSYGRKVQKLGRPAPQIEGLFAATGLSPLIACSVDTGDRGLISSFVERWHKQTSSFHLPVGEVSITLDDVASLLHLPIVGLTFQPLHVEEAVLMLVGLLEVSEEATRAETTHCHGPYCWIYEHFPSVAECIVDPNYDELSPRACRWIATKATVKFISTATYRQRLDRLKILVGCLLGSIESFGSLI
ncbi:protein MAIN-LIKE 2-like [Glycine soja]|uniref:protein MAIN-LIKE 2-like n=1 Tax=Glycine soja TaxID=3848 RepID=UPI00103A7EC1|nr:protein MAIN-LIKE 2-like [Glycine soja]